MRTTNKPEILLSFLIQNEEKVFCYKELSTVFACSTWTIIQTIKKLKKKGLLVIPDSLDNRKRKLIVPEEIKMARLRKREIITPKIDREELNSSLRRSMYHKDRKERSKTDYIRIDNPIMEIIQFWNSHECLQKIRVPDEKLPGNIYNNPTQTLTETVFTIRRLLSGKLLTDCTIKEIRRKNREFTVEEVKESIKNYLLASCDTNYEPIDKQFLTVPRTPARFIENFKFARTNMYRSLFLYFLENPPKLTPAARAREPMSVIEDGKEREWVEEITTYLITVYEKAFGKEEKQGILENAAIKLYDFAEEHGGVYVSLESGLETWPYWVIKALEWKKETSQGKFKVKSWTLLQDWFYQDILIPYIHYIQADHTIDWPETENASS